jgi:protein-tyrosine-phosphatase
MAGEARERPLRVLFLCTGNSARSQMAEAILNHKAAGRIVARSAGSQPAARVHPLALDTLRAHGLEWAGHPPQGIEQVLREPWDLVVTVCDHAKESCPLFPSAHTQLHWGMPDPAAAGGDDTAKRAAFRDAYLLLSRRIDLLLALPLERLERLGRSPGAPPPSA